MKNELKIIAAILYWLLLIGAVLPALISTPHTELVILGIALGLVSAYITYRCIRAALTKKEVKEDA